MIPYPEAQLVRAWAIKGLFVGLILYVCFIVRDIWLPLGIAFLIAMVLDPVVDRMQRRGWSRQWASIFIFGSFLIIVGGLCVLAEPYLVDQVSSLEKQFGRYFPDTSHKGLEAAVLKLKIPAWIGTIGIRGYEGFQAGLQKSSSWFTDYGMRFISNLIWVVIVPIVAFYGLRDFHLILAKALLLVPSKNRHAVQTGVTEITAVFAKYLRGLMIVTLLNGVCTAVLLMILHVPSALILGIVAGLLYAVPYIGAMMTIVLTAAFAFVGGGPQAAVVAVVASFILHQVVFDQMVTPRVLGSQVGLHPIISIIALLSGNLLLGIVGMILAVPVAACIQIAIFSVLPILAQVVEVTLTSSHIEAVTSSNEQSISETTVVIDVTQEMHAQVVDSVDVMEQIFELEHETK